MYVLFESLIQKNTPALHMGKIVSALLVLRGSCYFVGILGSVLVLKLLDTGSLLLVGALLMLAASMLVKADRVCASFEFDGLVKSQIQFCCKMSAYGLKEKGHQPTSFREILGPSTEFCTSRRLSYAPIAGFPLSFNKALRGEEP